MIGFVLPELQTLLLLAQQVSDGQYAIMPDGQRVATPHLAIKTKNGTLQVGKAYRSGNNDIYLGITYVSDKPKPTIVHPVDTSAIKKSYTFSYNINGKQMSGEVSYD